MDRTGRRAIAAIALGASLFTARALADAQCSVPGGGSCGACSVTCATGRAAICKQGFLMPATPPDVPRCDQQSTCACDPPPSQPLQAGAAVEKCNLPLGWCPACAVSCPADHTAVCTPGSAQWDAVRQRQVCIGAPSCRCSPPVGPPAPAPAPAPKQPYRYNGRDYFIVGNNDTGAKACARAGRSCVGYTAFANDVCKYFHPSASAGSVDSGSKAGFYCNGAPQGGLCASVSDGCRVCPGCAVNAGCASTIDDLYRELYVECTPPQPVPFNGKSYYVVNAADPDRNTGRKACNKVGKRCVGFTAASTGVCKYFHPSAVEATIADGSSAGFYCDGPPQQGACGQRANTCAACPSCAVNADCDTDVSPLYRELYVECQ